MNPAFTVHLCDSVVGTLPNNSSVRCVLRKHLGGKLRIASFLHENLHFVQRHRLRIDYDLVGERIITGNKLILRIIDHRDFRLIQFTQSRIGQVKDNLSRTARFRGFRFDIFRHRCAARSGDTERLDIMIISHLYGPLGTFHRTGDHLRLLRIYDQRKRNRLRTAFCRRRNLICILSIRQRLIPGIVRRKSLVRHRCIESLRIEISLLNVAYRFFINFISIAVFHRKFQLI